MLRVCAQWQRHPYNGHVNVYLIRLCRILSTSLERAAPASIGMGGTGWTRNELRRHVEGGGLSRESGDLASQELRAMLHQIGHVLDRSAVTNDKDLAMSLVHKHVLLPAQSRSLSPEILTLGLQALEKMGAYEKAIDLYYEQKMKGAVDTQHLTSLFRVLRMAVEEIVRSHKSKWNNQSFKYRDSKQAMNHANERDSEIFTLLSQALDLYQDGTSTSDPRRNGAANSHIVANSILGVLMAAPKSVLSANPELLEEAIAVMLHLHRTEDGLKVVHDGAPANATVRMEDSYTLPVEPHRGVYGQLILLAGRAGMLSIALSLHENMTQEADLYPTVFTETCMLTALGDCGEYEKAHTLFDNMVKSSENSEDGPTFGRLGVRAVTKYMEICLASGDIGRGLQAFKNWRKHSSERPTWYCYQVLHSLAKHRTGSDKRTSTKRAYNKVSEATGNINNPTGGSDGEDIATWNPPGQWSTQRVAKEQSEALKLVTAAVREGLLKPYLYGEVPLSLISSEVGCHLIATGYLDVIAETRLCKSSDPEISRCWTTLAHLLRLKGYWRDLLSMHSRLNHGHSDLNISARLAILGSTLGALNALEMDKDGQNVLNVDDEASTHVGRRTRWLWDSHMHALLDQTLESDAKAKCADERFRFQQLFYALRGGRDGSSLIPAALKEILNRAAVYAEKEQKGMEEILHPRVLTDAIFNCTDAKEVSFCLQIYSDFMSNYAMDSGEVKSSSQRKPSGKRAVLKAITEIGIMKDDKLMEKIDKLF